MISFTVYLEFFTKIDPIKSSFEKGFYWPAYLSVGSYINETSRWEWHLQPVVYNRVTSKLWALTFLRLLTLYKLWTKNEAYF